MSKTVCVVTLMACSIFMFGQPNARQFVSFDYPAAGVTDTEGTGITPYGVIVGRYVTADGQQHAFLFNYGQFITIHLAAISTFTDAAWINGRGDIAGDYSVGGKLYAYVLSPRAELVSFAFPGALATTGWGVNDAGDVTGTEYGQDFFSAHGYVFSHGAFSTIDFPGAKATWPTMINNAGAIVGTYFAQDSTYHGFLSQGGQFSTVDYPNSTFTWITGINTAGHIVGFYNDSGGTQHGFVLRAGQFIAIDVPGAISTEANGINPDDNVVGRYVTPDGHTHGYYLKNLN